MYSLRIISALLLLTLQERSPKTLLNITTAGDIIVATSADVNVAVVVNFCNYVFSCFFPFPFSVLFTFFNAGRK